MNNKSEKLAFYCELCNKFLDSNICKVHGIDFVTIKKVPASQNFSRPGQPNRGTQQNPGYNNTTMNTGETRIATAGQSQRQSYLPALPDDVRDNQSLSPLSPEIDLANNSYARQQYANGSGGRADFQPQISFQDPAGDYSEYQDPSAASSTPSGARTRKGARVWIIAGALSGLLIVASAAFFFMNQQQAATPTVLYSQAESYFDQQNYEQAEQLYNQFVNEFPNDPLIPLVQDKLSKIPHRMEIVQVGDNETRQQIKELMLKANVAFQKDQYILPKDDNALAYIVDILKTDPTYSPALDMKIKINQYYDQEAAAAVKNGEYNKAIGFYQRMLEITPNDTELLAKIHAILTSKSRNES